MRVSAGWALIASLIGAACKGGEALKNLVDTASDRRNTSFTASFNDYRAHRANKALVLARGDSNWAWGWSADDNTMAEALTQAFSHCEHSRLNSHIDAKCRLYAVNDEVVIDYTPSARKQLLNRYESVTPEMIP